MLIAMRMLTMTVILTWMQVTLELLKEAVVVGVIARVIVGGVGVVLRIYVICCPGGVGFRHCNLQSSRKLFLVLLSVCSMTGRCVGRFCPKVVLCK